jgi:tRNA threonylcarbamoyladenosine biosynthesis protein TsaE
VGYFDADIAALLPQLKKKLARPWLIFLEGDLGAGKTTWTQEFVAALGGNSHEVKSPTFLKLLTHEVPGFGQVLHIDAYRIEDAEDFLKMGMESYERLGAIVVEWPEVFGEFLRAYPEYRSLLGLRDCLRIRFGIDPTRTSRVESFSWESL